ncbi:NAD-dependent epimerase/dehydratase family protein [Streptomyces sp. NPDC052396]|uniref:NAD-dependent epimerase/dehydratase family protein n=1 Tax=Streptomyces sp. NPDC052396 TaxID=3365689 RepID=UPI0037D4FC80
MTLIVVTGAGGFIGSHLVRRLVREGHRVRGADLAHPRHEPTAAQEFVTVDLRDPVQARCAVAGADTVYALAANMGGIGWTHQAPAEILHDNLLISTHTIEACRAAGVRTTLYTSSACVYPGYLQREPDAPPLAEHRVFPAEPDMEYGWEKLTTELLCKAYRKSHGMDIKIARLHAIYGPVGEFDGPRAKSLAMLCTKVARLDGDEGEIEVWGDGTQTRSYCYIDDCVEGLIRLARSEVTEPLNIGSEERIDIASLVDRIAHVAGKKVRCAFAPDRPVGPRGRSSDNTRCRQLLGWEPGTTLQAGLERTYPWIAQQVAAGEESADG